MTVQTIRARNTIAISPRYLRIKRVFDIVFTLLALPFLGVIVGIVAVAIRLNSKGPIFFRQKRVGLHGVEFDMFKFRSMYHQCDDAPHRKSIEQYMANQPLNGNTGTINPQYKLVDDPRVTRVGQFLRKTSIDELPQFINVLRGEMTLVGPRPPLLYEVERYNSHDWLRLCGRPGLTGTWQVYGRGRVPFSTMVDMDIAYLQQQSLLEDFKLILLTFPIMLRGTGGV